jgi:arsenical pump membrane protein
VTHDVAALVEVVGFLVAIMVLARSCADAGLFTGVGALVARRDRSPARALVSAVAASALVTTALSLDATVVLLTPVLMAASHGRRDHAYATVRLANSGSLLLPISNLTNLLVFPFTGLSFLGFAWAMLPVWALMVGLELLVLHRRFRHDRVPAPPGRVTGPVPLYPAAVVIAVLLALASGATPWIPATAGAALVAIPRLLRGTTSGRDLLHAANLPLAGLVVVWGSLASWAATTEVASDVEKILPAGDSLLSIVTIAVVAMLVAGVINNLPATLLLLPAVATAGPGAMLALLVGVNVGANLSVIGSLANLLWLQTSARDSTSLREFHLLGLTTTPLLVLAASTTLWAWTSLIW